MSLTLMSRLWHSVWTSETLFPDNKEVFLQNDTVFDGSRFTWLGIQLIPGSRRRRRWLIADSKDSGIPQTELACILSRVHVRGRLLSRFAAASIEIGFFWRKNVFQAFGWSALVPGKCDCPALIFHESLHVAPGVRTAIRTTETNCRRKDPRTRALV